MDIRETIIEYVIDTYALNKDREVVEEHVDEWLDNRQQVNSVGLGDVKESECKTCDGKKAKRDSDGSIVICLDC